MLEAKDQGHKRKRFPKKKKKGLRKNFSGDLQKKKSSQKFFKQSPRTNVFQKIFQVLHEILTIQKILLLSSRGQANFRGLEVSGVFIQNFNDSKNCAVLEPRTAQFLRT